MGRPEIFNFEEENFLRFEIQGVLLYRMCEKRNQTNRSAKNQGATRAPGKLYIFGISEK